MTEIYTHQNRNLIVNDFIIHKRVHAYKIGIKIEKGCMVSACVVSHI